MAPIEPLPVPVLPVWLAAPGPVPPSPRRSFVPFVTIASLIWVLSFLCWPRLPAFHACRQARNFNQNVIRDDVDLAVVFDFEDIGHFQGAVLPQDTHGRGRIPSPSEIRAIAKPDAIALGACRLDGRPDCRVV